MRNQRSGRIINISSVVGFIPSRFSALYTATKHAVEGYSESLDHEVRSLGIRVLLVEPAFTRTALDHNSTQPDRMVSVYDGGRKSTEAVWNSAIKEGDAPEVVGEAVVKAASAKSPKLRYPANKAARLPPVHSQEPAQADEIAGLTRSSAQKCSTSKDSENVRQ